jgi:CubicO group peptidase (beta-lactamase class C family)
MTSSGAGVERALTSLFPRQEGTQYWFRSATGEAQQFCAGLATRVPPEPVTPRTTFHCFSTTKPVTALAVLQLVMEGRVLLDAPLITYLPELPYHNGATVRQVLSHQAGFPNPLPLSWVHADGDHPNFDASRFLECVLREHPTCGPAGRRARYSNIGFLLLGRLIEAIEKRAYTDVVRDRILGIVGSTEGSTEPYLGFDIPAGRHAAGYTRRWSGLGLFIALLPDATRLRSNEGAWIRYRPFHLNGASYGGLKGNVDGWAPLLVALATRDPRLLSPKGYDAFFAPQALLSGRATGHALAWFTGRHAGHDYVCHAGGGPGYGAEIRLYPSLAAASVLLTNTTIIRDARLLNRLDATWLP